MAPALTIDNTPDFDMLEVDMSSDFNMPQAGNKPNLDPEVDPSKLTIKHRTLLISPPSVSTRPEKIAEVLEAHDRDATDLHMLDRLIANAVDLPDAAYDTVLIISNEQGDPRESAQLFTANANVFVKIMKSMKPGAMMRSQDLTFGFGDEMIEGVMAGMIVEPDGDRGLQKPEWAEDEVVPLKTKKPVRYLGQDENGNVINEKQYASRILLDEDGYIDEDSLMRDVPNIKPDYSACQPRIKNRRACPDCTCGLAQQLQLEEKARKEGLMNDANTMKLDSNDLSEIDFTVKGKTGSCGNCALGDAFRCSGCPYVGMPPFKRGEQVKLMDNDIQL